MIKNLLILIFLGACSSNKPLVVDTEQKIVKKESTISLREYNFPFKEKNLSLQRIELDSDEEEFEQDFANALLEFKTANEEQFFNLGKKALPPEKFSMPVKNNYKITSQFGMRIHPIKKKKLFHKGIDILVPPKTKVTSSANGRVIMSKYTKAYGYVVIIAHSNNISTVYAHNEENLVRSGEFVKKGQLIALSGSSGDSTGPHIHFEIRKNNKSLEPISFLKDQKKIN